MPDSSRIFDQWIGQCCCHKEPKCIGMGGIIITSSGNVESAAFGSAGVGDITIGWCGHTGVLSTGSGDVSINNRGKAYVTSGVIGCNIGIVITGAPNHTVN